MSVQVRSHVMVLVMNQHENSGKGIAKTIHTYVDDLTYQFLC